MDLHKRVIILFALAAMFSLTAAALSPGVVQAEGDVPELPGDVEAPETEEVLPPESNVQDAVQALAESGTVLVQDGSGVPMASQTALQILCEPDPWFYGACLGGKCTGYATIQDALDAWVANAGFGFIYLEGGYSPPVTQDLPISGLDYPTLKGIVLDTTTAGPKPILVGYLDVKNFNTGFTLQGFEIRYYNADPPMYLEDNTGLFRMIDVDFYTPHANSSGFRLINNGPVEILRVNSGGAGIFGVVIDTCSLSGPDCTTAGSVKITSSSFNSNQDNFGLQITANGPVTLSGVSASYNTGNGINIRSTGPVVIKNSVFSGNQSGDSTLGYGLYVDPATTGAVTLDNVVLTNNSNHGAFISTSGNVILKNVSASLNDKGIMIAATTTEGSGAGALNVSVLNGVFHDNRETSLWVEAKGTITLTNIFSSSPDYYGLQLDNTYALAAPGVTLKNINLLYNGVGGGVVRSKGNIIVDSINIPSSPLAYGLDLDNTYGLGSVTINGTLFTNVFSYASNFAGLRINTTRNVLLNNVLAENNGKCGIEIWAGPNTGSVVLKNVTANKNGEWGVVVGTNGAISWVGGGASENGQNDTDFYDSGGASLDNVGALETASKPVTVSGLVLNGNLENVGLYIATRGTVTLTNITADQNAWDGIKVNKYPGAGSIKASLIHTVDNDIIGLNIYQMPGDWRSVNVSLNNITANHNGNWGVFVDTNGAVSWVKGAANDNGQSVSSTGGGASILNTRAAELASKPVTIRDITLNNNLRNNGLNIVTRGSVTLTNIQANENIGEGISIFKYTGVGNMLLTNVAADGNQYGIDITADSTVPRFNNVTLNNVSASNNDGFGIAVGANGNITWTGGAVLDNSRAITQNDVLLQNYNHVSPAAPFGVRVSNVSLINPLGYGLYAASYGPVILSGVISRNHQDYNVYLDTCGGSSYTKCDNTYLAPVTVIKSVFNNSHGITGFAGLMIRASGAVTLTGVMANDNSGKGAYINNRINSLLAKLVTVTGSTFNNNDTGMLIVSDGSIVLSSISASMNRTYEGVSASNFTSLAPRSVTISGVNNFNANKTTGLYVKSNGQISVSGARVSSNETMGIYLFSTLSGVNLSSSLVEGNKYAGVYIKSAGNVTVNTLNSFYNGWWDGDNGLTVDAKVVSGTPPFVTISNSNFLGNFNIGLYLLLNAPKEAHYTLINVTSIGNMLANIVVDE